MFSHTHIVLITRVYTMWEGGKFFSRSPTKIISGLYLWTWNNQEHSFGHAGWPGIWVAWNIKKLKELKRKYTLPLSCWTVNSACILLHFPLKFSIGSSFFLSIIVVNQGCGSQGLAQGLRYAGSFTWSADCFLLMSAPLAEFIPDISAHRLPLYLGLS